MKETVIIPGENCPGLQFCDMLTIPMSAALDYNLRYSDPVYQTRKVRVLGDMKMQIKVD